MIQTSVLWKQIAANVEHVAEYRVTLGGISYENNEIESISITRPLFDELSVGNVCSSQMDLSLYPRGEIPRMAQITVDVRLVYHDSVSEWAQLGVYWLSTRDESDDGKLKITAYDVILKGEQTYVLEGEQDEWPKPMKTVAEDIAQLMGTSIDTRTVLNASYQMEYPNDYTMREILGYIAAAHCGNWVATNEGKLRLVPLFSEKADGADSVDVGQYLTDWTLPHETQAISKVIVWWDDENAFSAGTDTGATLEIDCPWATQAITNTILSLVSGKTYQPYSAGGASVDLAVELGDGISVNGIYSVIANMQIASSGLMTVSAPGEDEVDNEYPYESQTERKLARKVTLGTNYYGTKITRANGLEIVKTDGETEKSRVVLNSDILAFYNDDGNEALYFDNNAGKFKFVGDVEIESGTINIGNNFIVDANGNVRMNGNINLSSGNITWGSNEPGGVTEEEVIDLIYQYGGDDLPSYIKSTYIDSTTILTPKIYAGEFYATGQGRNSGAAYYIYSGVTGSGANLRPYGEIGYISYDSSGAGTTEEAAERVIFKTLSATALKIQASGNMSIESDYGTIYIPTDTTFHEGSTVRIIGRLRVENYGSSGTIYGSSLPSSGVQGQIFFKRA